MKPSNPAIGQDRRATGRLTHFKNGGAAGSHPPPPASKNGKGYIVNSAARSYLRGVFLPFIQLILGGFRHTTGKAFCSEFPIRSTGGLKPPLRQLLARTFFPKSGGCAPARHDVRRRIKVRDPTKSHARACGASALAITFHTQHRRQQPRQQTEASISMSSAIFVPRTSASSNISAHQQNTFELMRYRSCLATSRSRPNGIQLMRVQRIWRALPSLKIDPSARLSSLGMSTTGA